MQRPTSPPTTLGTWSAGKEPDALSKLFTGAIFYVQKCHMLVGDASPHSIGYATGWTEDA